MTRSNSKPSQPAQEGVSMDRDDVPEHGWGPDVNKQSQKPNPSEHRSFHPEEYAPEPGPGRTVAKEEGTDPGSPGKSDSTRGEDHAKKNQKGHHDHGPRGASGRPSGGRDATAVTGVDPQQPAEDHS